MRWYELPQAAWLFGGCFALFLIALLGTRLALRYAIRNRLLDQPGERRSHSVATPRGGGIAIVVTLLCAMGWEVLRAPGTTPIVSAVGIGLALVAGIGWADDHRPLSPWWRLCVHAAAAGLLAWAVLHEGGGPLAAAFAFVLAMALTNVWNFMDGIDGLAASQALLVAVGYASVAGQGMVVLLALALAAACLGFLPFNFPRARIFLGDVGSGALGYTVATLVALLAIRDWRYAPALLLPLSAFLIDASLTLASRMVRRERWWLPHTEHAYQRWVQHSGRHVVVTLAYAGWTLIGVAAMLAARMVDPASAIVMLVAEGLAGSVAWMYLRRIRRWNARGNGK